MGIDIAILVRYEEEAMSELAEAKLVEASARIAELEAVLAAERATAAERIAELEAERDRLRASHARLREELELLKRRIFIAKAERVDTEQLELEFADKLHQLDVVAGTLGMRDSEEARKARREPKGRRRVMDLKLPIERVVLTDPEMERLIEKGTVTRHGFDETAQVAHRRGGRLLLVQARARYKTVGADGSTDVFTTRAPEQLLDRCLAAPSLLAHTIAERIDGTPLYRQEQRFAREAMPLDRGTMARWHEELGGTFGSTVIEAMRRHAMATAFCIATDATGIAVQPGGSLKTRPRQPCHKGHYLLQLADRDHVFYEYLERETSAAISERFAGFSGYVQADAKSVFDALFEPPEDDDGPVRHEVGCWYHLRRKFWEATIAKSAVAREGLARIGRIFELEAIWRGKPPEEIQRLRDARLRTHVTAFFAWAEAEHDKVREQRGLLRSALGYAERQRLALERFLDDGRLVLDNNRSERALRKVAVGRKNWLFCGSHIHAQTTANLFTLVMSARLHDLDAEQYLGELIHVLPYWPHDRYLELAPKFWAKTRERLDPAELASEVSPITVPPAPRSSLVTPAT